jgi:putative acetyltransferase
MNNQASAGTRAPQRQGEHPAPRPCVVRLREARDDAALFRITNDETFQRFATHLEPLESLEHFRMWFAGLGSNRVDLVAEVEGEVVGFAVLFVMPDRQSHVGWFFVGVLEAFQNRGVGSRLLQILLWIGDAVVGLRRIQLNVYCSNTKAVKLYLKFGFEIEGRHRDFVLYRGQMDDSLTMARIRADAAPPANEAELTARLAMLAKQTS